MNNTTKNLIAIGIVGLAGYLFLNIDDTAAKAQKAQKKAQKELEKQGKRQKKANRNKSLIEVLRTATPLLSPVMNVAIDEFKDFRARQKQQVL